NLWLGKYNQPTDTLSIYRMDPITGSVGAAVGTIASFGSGSYLQCFTYALGFLSGSGFYLLRVAYKPSAPNAVNIARLYSVGTGGVTLLSTISDTINFTGGFGNYMDLTGLSYDT